MIGLPAKAASKCRESADHVPNCRLPLDPPQPGQTVGVPTPPRDVATQADNNNPVSPLCDAVILSLHKEIARIVGEQRRG